MLFRVFATFGLPAILVRELSANIKEKDQIIGTSIFIKLLLLLITLMFIFLSLILWESDKNVVKYICIYSMIIAFDATNPTVNLLQATLNNKLIAIAEIIRTITGTALKILVVLIDADLSVFFFVYAISYGTYHFAVLFFTRYIIEQKVLLKNLRINFSKLKYLIKESYPLFFSGIAMIIYQEIDKVMIRNMLDNEQIGYYAVAARIFSITIFIPAVIAQTLVPILVSKMKSMNEETFNQLAKRFVDFLLWPSVFISLFFSLLSGFFILLLYGKTYIPAIPVLQILAWKTSFAALAQGANQIIIIQGKHKYLPIKDIFGATINVVLNFIFIPVYGIVGSAWATLISYAFAGFISNLFFKSYWQYFNIQANSILFGSLRFIKHVIFFIKYKKVDLMI